jgi:lysophospholipase
VTQERVEKSDVTMREPGADDTCGEAAKSVRRLASDVRLTTAEIDNLRASLPDMDFDPARDSDPAQALIAEKYLRLYGMDYADKYLHRWGRVMLPRYTIACHYWFPDKTMVPPDKGVVVVLHGYFDHVGLFGHLIRHLLERGYGVVAFDLPGHGLSSGERASIATFAHYVEVFEAVLREISKAFPVPVAAVGQSTGGAILLNYLARGGAGLDRVALLAPLVEPRGWWLNRIVYTLSHRFLKQVGRAFMDNSNDADFVRFIARDPLQPRHIPIAWLGAMKGWVAECRAMQPRDYPLTILQGTADTTLAWRSNMRLLRRKFPAARVVLIEGARHHLANESPALRQRVFDQLGL